MARSFLILTIHDSLDKALPRKGMNVVQVLNTHEATMHLISFACQAPLFGPDLFRIAYSGSFVSLRRGLLVLRMTKIVELDTIADSIDDGLC